MFHFDRCQKAGIYFPNHEIDSPLLCYMWKNHFFKRIRSTLYMNIEIKFLMTFFAITRGKRRERPSLQRGRIPNYPYREFAEISVSKLDKCFTTGWTPPKKIILHSQKSSLRKGEEAFNTAFYYYRGVQPRTPTFPDSPRKASGQKRKSYLIYIRGHYWDTNGISPEIITFLSAQPCDWHYSTPDIRYRFLGSPFPRPVYHFYSDWGKYFLAISWKVISAGLSGPIPPTMIRGAWQK